MPKYRFDEIAINSTTKKKPVEEDKYTYLGLEHLDSGSLKVTRFGSDVAPIGEKLLMKKGDVLFGKRRAYQKKVAIAPFDGIFSAHGMVLRPKEEVIDKDFFPLFISSDYFLDAAIKISVGSLSPTINWRDLKGLEFELPSLEEQKRLAEVLWSINNTLDAYKKLLETTDQLVKSQFIEMFGVPFQNEKRWQIQSLDEICTYLTDGSHYSPKEDTNGIYPMLTVKDMTERGFDYGDCKLIGEEEYAKMVANGCVPKVGDVLVAKDGSYFKTAFVIEDEREQAVLSSIAILRPDKAKMVPRFMREYLMSGQVLKAVESEYITGTAIKRVILKKLKTMPIYIPPISMQEKYVALVEQSDKSKFELEQSIAELTATYKRIIMDNIG
ncbi:MAG: restriction endonuclease subunit S [Butyrivibrio sp.]|uniref:restriction endonuclease subunit S n=1 Tax=Butyrivibrio sp. TaxID=28121 RepID=UPI0025E73E65|nr:restriction endonuclease subunit S [Butyrivibrio sp.]MCR5772790.1 restriction endonuclease subunit S [Butyrivibrio sp.]